MKIICKKIYFSRITCMRKIGKRSIGFLVQESFQKVYPRIKYQKTFRKLFLPVKIFFAGVAHPLQEGSDWRNGKRAKKLSHEQVTRPMHSVAIGSTPRHTKMTLLIVTGCGVWLMRYTYCWLPIYNLSWVVRPWFYSCIPQWPQYVSRR